MKTRTKLSVVLSVILLFGFLATNIVNYMVSKKSLHDTIIHSTLPLISNNIYSEIQKDLMRPVYVSSLMANDTFLKDWALAGEEDIPQVVRYLSEIKQKYEFFSSFFISAHTHFYYYYDGILKAISEDDAHDVWYYNFKTKNVAYDLDVDTDEATDGTLTVFINHRLLDYGGNFLGVTGVGLKMENVGKVLSSYRDRYGREVYLVDPEGIIQVHSDKGLIQTTSIFEQEGLAGHASAILESKEETRAFEFDRGDSHILLSSRYIPEFDWYLMVEQDETASLSTIRANLFRNLLFGLAITLFVILINVFTVNYFQGKLERLATMDELTGLHNRRHFMELAGREWGRGERYERPLALLMVDVDHFKSINDRYGHDAGDSVLRGLGGVFGRCFRDSDVIGRIGGEEFAVLLPEADLDHAVTVATRFLREVEETPFRMNGGHGSITVSIGAAAADPSTASLDELLKQADLALYAAKQNGRNQVQHRPPVPEMESSDDGDHPQSYS